MVFLIHTCRGFCCAALNQLVLFFLFISSCHCVQSAFFCPSEAKPQLAHKNGKKAEVGGGTSFFTWFMVLALLGVWTSVAVVYFDLVDYQGVIGESLVSLFFFRLCVHLDCSIKNTLITLMFFCIWP